MKTSKCIFSDYKLWVPSLRLHLNSKKWRKHFKKIYFNLKMVDMGIKPSFLWDIGPIPPILQVELLLNSLKICQLLKPCVFFFKLEDELFVSNKEALVNLFLDKGLFKFVNITSQCLLEESAADTQKMLINLQKHVDLLCEGNSGNTLTLDKFPDNGLIRIYGILLGYPIVFCIASNEKCLNFVSLVNIKVCVVLEGKIFEIYSFCHFPDEYLSKHVDEWYNKLSARFEHCHFKLFKNNVLLPTVVL